MNNFENNKLIAEFMGMGYNPNHYNLMNHGLTVIDRTKTFASLNELRFHKSWDWLMPVLEKIEQLEIVDEVEIKWCFVYKNHVVRITNSFKDSFCPIYVSKSNKFTAVYDAIVEFIKWYNKNKEQ